MTRYLSARYHLDGRVLENPANLDETIAGRLNDPEDENETVLYGNVISEIVPPSQCEGVIVIKFGDLDAGWHESKTGLRTYVDAATGCTVNGWQIIDKELYYFKDTVMCTGWKQINGKWYFFDEDGSYIRQDYYKDGEHEEIPTADDSSTDSYTVETGWITRFRALLKRMAQNIINGL